MLIIKLSIITQSPTDAAPVSLQTSRLLLRCKVEFFIINCVIPLQKRTTLTLGCSFQFAFNVCHEIELTSSRLKKLIDWPPKVPRSLAQLQKLEALHEGLDFYLWLRCGQVLLVYCNYGFHQTNFGFLNRHAFEFEIPDWQGLCGKIIKVRKECTWSKRTNLGVR